jgi:2-polyprenyl-3-methyl-5-hydroxy-6-metoxy-1,4-benzoquinol methylase
MRNPRRGVHAATISSLRPFSVPSLLRQVQEEIAADGFSRYYREVYRAEEFCYWGPIARWLAQIASQAGPAASLLDIGCAYGTLLFYARLLGFRSHGLDRRRRYLSPRLLARYRVAFLMRDIEFPTPLPPGWSSFRVILFTEVLEHLNFHPLPTLQRLRTLLSPHGELLLSTPDAAAGWGRGLLDLPFERLPARRAPRQFVDDHVKTYTAQELLRLLHAAGFRARLYRWQMPGHRGHLLARCRPCRTC